MFSENTNLNSSKVKVFALFFPAILLIIFALVVNWVPSFIEEQRSMTPSLEKRVLVINEVIEKLKSDDAVDKEGLIKIFDSAIKKEIATEAFIDSIIGFLKPILSSINSILLIYFASILFLFQSLFKQKT